MSYGLCGTVNAARLLSRIKSITVNCPFALTDSEIAMHAIFRQFGCLLLVTSGVLFGCPKPNPEPEILASQAAADVTPDFTIDEIFASPVAFGNRLYLRVADSRSGSRQATLYCIGENE